MTVKYIFIDLLFPSTYYTECTFIVTAYPMPVHPLTHSSQAVTPTNSLKLLSLILPVTSILSNQIHSSVLICPDPWLHYWPIQRKIFLSFDFYDLIYSFLLCTSLKILAFHMVPSSLPWVSQPLHDLWMTSSIVTTLTTMSRFISQIHIFSRSLFCCPADSSTSQSSASQLQHGSPNLVFFSYSKQPPSSPLNPVIPNPTPCHSCPSKMNPHFPYILTPWYLWNPYLSFIYLGWCLCSSAQNLLPGSFNSLLHNLPGTNLVFSNISSKLQTKILQKHKFDHIIPLP